MVVAVAVVVLKAFVVGMVEVEIVAVAVAAVVVEDNVDLPKDYLKT